MHLFGDEFPSSKAKELGAHLSIPHATLQDFSHNNMGNVKGMSSIIGGKLIQGSPGQSEQGLWRTVAMEF